jgi:hypothetical protein
MRWSAGDATRSRRSWSNSSRGGRRVRLVWARANGQPAFGHYIEAAGDWRALGVIALSLEGEHISGLTRFANVAIMPRLGLPRAPEPQ